MAVKKILEFTSGDSRWILALIDEGAIHAGAFDLLFKRLKSERADIRTT